MARKPDPAKKRPPRSPGPSGNVDAPEAIRDLYAAHGVAGCYASRGSTYRNPFEAPQRELLAMAVDRFALDLSNVLDLACGSGEATLALRDLAIAAGSDARFAGIDPYTGAAYRERTGLEALPLSFEQIADGGLEAALPGERFALVACCCALHLCEPSRLPALLWRLRDASTALLVTTPNKRPEVRPEWGWRLEGEILHKRLRARVYRAG